MRNIAFDFRGRTAVVTGAARGIGAEIASLFADAGASVYLVDQDDEVEQIASKIGGVAVIGDVGDTETAETTINCAVDQTGRVDILVNNAGILRDSVLWKMTDTAWEEVINTHMGGTFRFLRAAAPHFRAQGFGRVINVTSYSGLHGNVGQLNYAGAKAGIIGMSKTAAKELANFGVTVNVISPTARTRMTDSVPDSKLAQLASLIPMQRFATPAEMAPTVAFLASEEASYITGAVVLVDGGMSI